MKVFLQILLYLICSECRIEDGPVEGIPYTYLGVSQTDNINKNRAPILIKDLNDYTNYHLEFYGTYPSYTDFDFTKNMIVVFFISSSQSDIKIDDIYETNDRISIHMYHQPTVAEFSFRTYCQNTNPKTYMVGVVIKRTDKTIMAYG